MIPTYNQAAFIAECVGSALAQDYNRLEVVISDDNSTDGTEFIIKEFVKDPRVKYYRSRRNLGRVANYRNLLYTLVRGEWVVNCDGDDFFIDYSFISHAISWALKDKSVVMVGAGGKIARGQEQRTYRITPNDMIIDGLNLFLNWPKKGPPHLASLYKRSLAMELGFYNQNIISSDKESMLRLTLNGKVAILSSIVGIWRKHEANASNSLNIMKFIEDFKSIDTPYQYALQKGFNRNKFSHWRSNMVYASLIDYLYRSCQETILHPPGNANTIDNVKQLFCFVISKYPFAFFHLDLPFRFAIFFLLGPQGYAGLVRGYNRIRHPGQEPAGN